MIQDSAVTVLSIDLVAAGEAAFPMQVRPTIGGMEMIIDVIDVMVFDDDARIVDMRAFWDPTEMRPADD